MDSFNPQYWYRDSTGQLQKLIYCRLCHAGSFKQEDKGTKFKIMAMNEIYCIKCYGYQRFEDLEETSNIPVQDLLDPKDLS